VGAWAEEVTNSGPELDSLLAGEPAVEGMLRTQEPKKIASFLSRTVYPYLLRDFLHYVYEALECSRKGKTTLTFSLLRKPLKESLFVLEVLSADPLGFAQRFRDEIDTLSCDARDVNGSKTKREWHEERVQQALQAANAIPDFDPGYITQLRYCRDEEDSFAGLFDKATHLVTSFRAIKTEPLNFNFVFSDDDSVETHWAYIYSRLPYLLSYVWRISEHVFARFSLSDPVYLDDIERRVMARVLQWDTSVRGNYRHPKIDAFIERTRVSLDLRCAAAGWRSPSRRDLDRMAESGAWPGESGLKVRARAVRYFLGVRASGLPGQPKVG